MSLYEFDILRCDGKLFAYTRIQNDYTGNVSGYFKRIYQKDADYYFKADGRKHICTNQVASFVRHEVDRKQEHDFYIKYRNRIY